MDKRMTSGSPNTTWSMPKTSSEPIRPGRQTTSHLPQQSPTSSTGPPTHGSHILLCDYETLGRHRGLCLNQEGRYVRLPAHSWHQGPCMPRPKPFFQTIFQRSPFSGLTSQPQPAKPFSWALVHPRVEGPEFRLETTFTHPKGIS